LKGKPVVPRELANRDVNEAIAWHLGESTESVALGFIDALEAAYIHISRHPATASPGYGHVFNLPDLRFWPLRRYPYLVFYLERPDQFDVWRVLHGKRDIPAWLAAADERCSFGSERNLNAA
jgi:toxin ParE1/3/4